MSELSTIRAFFKKIGGFAVHALAVAGANGLTDDLVHTALTWVRVAARKELNNTAKREWVIAILVNKRVPESVARLAVELAVQLLKKELAKVG